MQHRQHQVDHYLRFIVFKFKELKMWCLILAFSVAVSPSMASNSDKLSIEFTSPYDGEQILISHHLLKSIICMCNIFIILADVIYICYFFIFQMMAVLLRHVRGFADLFRKIPETILFVDVAVTLFVNFFTTVAKISNR